MRRAAVLQGRLLASLGVELETPVVGSALRLLTRDPRVDDGTLAGVPVTVARPARGSAWPALVFVTGASAAGRRHPAVQGLARGLARAGFVLVAPDPAGLAAGELTAETIADLRSSAAAVASAPWAAGGRVGLLGVSAGAALALVAAQDAELGSRVSVVSGVAPYAELREALRIATTGTYCGDGAPQSWRVPPFFSLVLARSLAAALDPSDGNALLVALRRLPDDAQTPIASVEPELRSLTGDAAALARIFLDPDPEHFDDLYGSLPERVRHRLDELSPLAGMPRVSAPVELASAPRDRYFPLAESRRLAAAARRGRVTVTETLDHAIPRPTPHELAALGRFDAWLVRSLRHASLAAAR